MHFYERIVMPEQLCILEFDTVDEAVSFAKEIDPESNFYEDLYSIAPNETWLFVLAVCDICKRNSIFFAPAEIYEDGISAVECKECGNMSVYPKEGSFEDE